MPKASLLLRETLSSSSLTNIVEKSQNQKPPFLDYEIKFNSTKLDLVVLKPKPNQIPAGVGGPQPGKPYQAQNPQHQDEGFESDIDSLSLISSDESFTSSTCLVEDHVLKHQHQETDSANGSSSSSESDTEHPGANPNSSTKESFPLNDVLCYTDVTYPKVLVFVIKDDVFVFSFDNLEYLHSFYTSFNTLKAVTNQRTYGNCVNIGAKFNLLQRTDSNGVTHIEISRENVDFGHPQVQGSEGSNIICMSTPEGIPKKVSLDDSKIYLQNERKSSRSEFYPNTTINSFTLKPRSSPGYSGHSRQPGFPGNSEQTGNSEHPRNIEHPRNPEYPGNSEFPRYPGYPPKEDPLKKIFSRSLKDLAINDSNKQQKPLDDDQTLKKTWKSAESLLEEPKRPERRRKPKGRAPPPPTEQKPSNVMKGQYVRVSVDPKNNPEKPLKLETPNFQTFSPNVQTFTPNWNNIRTPQSPLVLSTTLETQKKTRYEYKKNEEQCTKHQHSWTNSVPRLLRKQRSKSETRQNLTPMAYRYIDTTQHLPKGNLQQMNTTSTISNRLFGLSQKLKEFGSNVVAKDTGRGFTSYYEVPAEQRRNSLGEMTYKKNSSEANLKSVIKKDDKKKSEKKVTFSAYATVQVV